jgi:hypothetical protein
MSDDPQAFYFALADQVLPHMSSGDREQSAQVMDDVAFVLGAAVAIFCEGDEELGEVVLQRMFKKARRARAEVVQATIDQRMFREGYEQ